MALTNLTFWRSTEPMNRFKNLVFGFSLSVALLPSPPPLAPAPPSSSDDSSASASAAAAAMVAAACASSDEASLLRGCDQLILRMFGTFAGGSGGSAAASGVEVGMGGTVSEPRNVEPNCHRSAIARSDA